MRGLSVDLGYCLAGAAGEASAVLMPASGEENPPMLPFLNLPPSLLELLSALRPCFTAPGFATLCGLAPGWPGSRGGGR